MVANSTSEICYIQAVSISKIWYNEAPLLNALPRLFLQMTVAMASNIIFFHILQPLHQPRIVSDIIGGLVLHPSLLDKINRKWSLTLWPEKGTTLLHVMANLGLVFVLFFQGLQLDMSPISRCSKRTWLYITILILMPNVIGVSLGTFFDEIGLLERVQDKGVGKRVYWGSILSITSFPTLASIIARLKLLCTDVGKEALSLGFISDTMSYLFLVQVIALSAMDPNRETRDFRPALFVLLFMLMFATFCAIVIRPIIMWIIRRTPEGENYSDTVIHGILFLVFACGALADFLGYYSVLGAFILGACIPNGLLASTLMDRMEDCVVAVLMPLYYAAVGFSFDLGGIVKHFNHVAAVVLATLIRPLCGLLASLLFGIPTIDGLALGVLLSAKGIIPIVGIKIGRDRGHLPKDVYSGMLLIILFSSMIVGPIMDCIHRRMLQKNGPYQQRTIEAAITDADFRVLACIHTPRNIPGIINLLEISNVTTRSPMSVFALHLIELMGRASAMLTVLESGDSSASSSAGSKPFFNRNHSQSYQIINAFQGFQADHHSSAAVESLAVVSPLDTMHEDIFGIAENKQIALIILPFHKHQGMDGKLEDSNFEFQPVNQNVFASGPCSVGLLVDRGIGMLGLSQVSSSSIACNIGGDAGSSARSANNRSSRREVRIAMVYVGGPDDREALSYAWRMAAHPFVTLTVFRLLVGENAMDVDVIDFPGDDDVGILTIMTQSEREKERDEVFLDMFRQRTENDESIIYTEKVSNSGEETVNLLREMENYYDLYVVGRGQSVLSPLTVGLAEWSECPELGAIGDVLVTSDFASHASVLVVQQYIGARSIGINGGGIPSSSTVLPF
ncbi:hypothetical protein Ancab_032050 [Ancistrocladus abbreviatus]